MPGTANSRPFRNAAGSDTATSAPTPTALLTKHSYAIRQMLAEGSEMPHFKEGKPRRAASFR